MSEPDSVDRVDSAPIDAEVRPRFLPEEPFPPYSYVTGRFPHPIRDPGGHSYGEVPDRPECPDPQCWRQCRPYLRGLDLFNHGYYWEAHEVWESLWHACGRTGTAADFFKGLIKLAAAGVKVRERRFDGVRTHARRANELFGTVSQPLPELERTYFGLDIFELRARAMNIAEDEYSTREPSEAPVEIVFPFVLRPN